MGRLLDTLAVTLHDLAHLQAHLRRAGRHEQADDLKVFTVEPLEDIVSDLEDDPQFDTILDLDESPGTMSAAAPRRRFPRRVRWRRRGPKVRWLCCGKVSKGRTRRGKRVWKAFCKWKKGSKTGGMVRIVGSARNKKPQHPMNIKRRC